MLEDSGYRILSSAPISLRGCSNPASWLSLSLSLSLASSASSAQPQRNKFALLSTEMGETVGPRLRELVSHGRRKPGGMIHAT